MKIDVVALPRFRQVSIEWTEELGLTDSLVHRYLADQLAWLHGVNSVTLKRYAVWLDIEHRVRTTEAVALDVLELLQEDPEFRFVIQQSVPPNIPVDLEFTHRESRCGPDF